MDLLFGNKSVEHVLLFLFVNGKCYGSQLHRQLHLALTPLQKALEKLEKGQVLVSFYEGKTKIYQFNPAYPLFDELEALLKKAYTLLAPQEKKRFSYLSAAVTSGDRFILDEAWKRLSQVSRLAFHAKTKSKDGGGWNGQAKGQVQVAREEPNVLIFYEKGSWKDKNGALVDFSNVYRFTLDRASKLIALEHLRHGIDHPVFLFHLAPDSPSSLASIDSHLCGGDSYFGRLLVDPSSIKLKWRVIGPKKNEEIEAYYT